MADNKIKKVVLAYSGGLDTSIIIPWLKKTTTTAKLSLFRVMLVRVQSLTVLKKRLSKQAHQNFTLKTSTRNLLTNISFPQ